MTTPALSYYNDLLLEISTNLQNTLNTFGPTSHQYRDVLQTLKDCIQQIEQNSQQVKPESLDPLRLGLAMELLSLKE
ncbi:hypothetical protein BGW36DRAFT_428348 [Talaromyces proteolyticus]|uniref:Uncharacterized protein n=1 Tax=Talaromyces proteolyticus TaxID=1131652 RepID=A0AAD4PVB0_9EURO|nr:uncharacterized protein BGW36DRAFT_428348 [Talaromyces proteolyticus]KAH8696335.1 hypothetical protein BGW36DRAFT_428348 [Talaromyces proteolyticus]